LVLGQIAIQWGLGLVYTGSVLILLHGEDTYRSRQRLRVLREAFQKKFDPHGFGMVRVNAPEAEPERIRTLLTNQGFFAKRRLVVLERVAEASSAVQAELSPLLKDAAKGEDPIVIRWEGKKLNSTKTTRSRTRRAAPKKPTAVSNASKSETAAELAPPEAKVEEFPLLVGPALTRWYLDSARARGFTLTTATAVEMVRRLGSDLWSGATNLDKLNAGRVGTEVDVPLVETLVVGTIPPGAFALTDAVAERRTTLAVTLLTHELAAGAAPLALLAQLTRQFRILVMVGSENATPAALAKRLGLHPYVAQKAAASARRFTPAEVLERFRELLDLERQFKSGHPNPALALERFVVAAGAKPPNSARNP
jgi:DNA polymerase-3 subunit delta